MNLPPGVNSKTVPPFDVELPAQLVEPNRLPDASRAKAPCGPLPSEMENVCR